MSLGVEWGTLHLIGRIIIGLIAVSLVYGTTIPLLRNDAWWVRIFDFPRIQIAALIGITLLAYGGLRLCGRLQAWDYTLAVMAALALIWQVISIAPYTALHPKEMADSKATNNANRISLLVYNVLSDNRKVEALRDLIRTSNPDLILLSEPKQWWLDQLNDVEIDYPYTLHQPQENNYGLLLYSRLELVEPEVRFLIEAEIPSIRTQVRLRSGALVTLYGMHPRPPGLKRSEDDLTSHNTPNKSADDTDDGERQDSDMRDAELMMVAKEIHRSGGRPVIVAGDFNDVAWSHTTHLFQRLGGLLDPRVGRGLFNTYDTRNRLLRYPLDHAFASRHFLLVDLQRLPDIGSDHFPLLVALDYNPEDSPLNDDHSPDHGDVEEADKAIRKARSEE